MPRRLSKAGPYKLRIVRYHHWYEIFCQLAPQTCALVKTRPEINECKFMNVNYVAGLLGSWPCLARGTA